MKRKKIILVLAVSAAALVFLWLGVGAINARREGDKSHSLKAAVYYCPMHPGYKTDQPGDCPICGMKLVKKDDRKEPPASARGAQGRVIYYRNPMDPQVTSPVPMKDSMGMDYVPVYGTPDREEAGVYISPQNQQIVGIKKSKIEKRKLTREITTVGSVAFDPDLFVAQQEYLQAQKTKDRLSAGSMRGQADGLEAAAKKRLLILGMSDEEISDLSKSGKPQENLYLSSDDVKLWIYAVVFEYDLGLVKAGQMVEVESIAYPGAAFNGKIAAVSPVLDPVTRSARVRMEIENPEHRLRPEMFVNAKIKIDLGEKIAVPEEAVIETGERNIVFVANPEGYFSSREVKLGAHAQDYYEVISGLKEGEEVVSSGNFFVDSESRLKSVISAEEHRSDQ